MKKNKLVIASAGSGKTTLLINHALSIIDQNVLITTYTEANEEEIRKKIIMQNGFIPPNITIQTWFSFLLQHGVRPYQGTMFEKKINGLILVNQKSAVKYRSKTGMPVCYKESEIEKHYFSKNTKIYSDKLSKFVIKCCIKSKNAVIKRLERIYDHILVDEVQDLAGYDLEFLKLLSKSEVNLLMVGDPRQVTYLTHLESKYSKYRNGAIKDFILNECKKSKIEIDESSLSASHRCNEEICDFASKLYPQLPQAQSKQNVKTEHDGVFFISPKDVPDYLKKHNPTQLRLSKRVAVDENFDVINFGVSKGLTFERVLIYPTTDMEKWIKNKNHQLKNTTRAKFYVALTRAKYSVGVVCK
jgi:DNA helicase-2/ATP-dependent DNA helicase PcrA